jgi:hypothetical protein
MRVLVGSFGIEADVGGIADGLCHFGQSFSRGNDLVRRHERSERRGWAFLWW